VSAGECERLLRKVSFAATDWGRACGNAVSIECNTEGPSAPLIWILSEFFSTPPRFADTSSRARFSQLRPERRVSRAVLSTDAVTNCVPSGLKAAELTHPLCPLSAANPRPEAARRLI
jgi:hypothetical protein